MAVTNQWLLLLPWVPRGRRKSVERRGICAAACRLWLCEGLSTEEGISSTPANQVELGKPKPFNSLTFRCTQILVLWKMCRFFLVRRGWPNALWPLLSCFARSYWNFSGAPCFLSSGWVPWDPRHQVHGLPLLPVVCLELTVYALCYRNWVLSLPSSVAILAQYCIVLCVTVASTAPTDPLCHMRSEKAR